MKTKTFVLGALAALAMATTAFAQEVTLRIHQMLPAQATIPAQAIEPWAQMVTEASGGRIAFELYPAMQLGGAPADLYDQAKDGVVDIVWTIMGYTPGRFPKSEVFELPFLITNGEKSSAAFYNYVMDNAADEYNGIKVLALHTHGPGLFHSKDPITKLEDLEGMKVRGGSRIISNMLAQLGAEPVGMPVTQTPEALSKGVIDATTVPWEVTPSLRISELVKNHTGFTSDHGLYSQTFGFFMNQDSYNNLPDDLKAVIDAHSGLEVSRQFGRVMDNGDAGGLAIAVKAGNNIVQLDETETARWIAAAQPTIDQWVADMTAAGVDGQALLDAARAAVAAEGN
ncbi:TRAP transporter substrate-binding protein [Devosia sp. 63-57]|uniref:TRAP transporter substrate-binding protein n=1 Tax=Devosia sp. 63-57 TaxID=1895751 RepID=UPI00086BFE0D|nr:TRAP transporter substrate-binding protein [Devosia sp. 63-57]ODT50975.1 MAG: C4-dicarboxylate ABC transporter [Pelagibacterium sp. SCN 63-126]ODU85511.1 MAG: C4-dicarboxylate ABC transporter [Pelagibacterium sp. SCN 63-17]OJX44366.1 MAG: C4-dicarboxylate ABC transporter [Devosia sp. 63-57]